MALRAVIDPLRPRLFENVDGPPPLGVVVVEGSSTTVGTRGAFVSVVVVAYPRLVDRFDGHFYQDRQAFYFEFYSCIFDG
ncbi:MAG: hypothetical protein AAF551_00665 [Bacteroidota bacterium]